MEDLKGFAVERVLSEDASSRTIALLGSKDGKPGVVLLSRRHFPADAVQGVVDGTQLALSFNNDVYYKFEGRPTPEHSVINVDVIYPATAKHISKHEEQGLVMVKETPEVYEKVTRPFIQSIGPERIQWVYNILSKEAEAERLLFEDEDKALGFMLHPDLKWDQSEVDKLYCLAICHSRDVRSLRDLGPAHLPMLRNIRDKGVQALESKFGVAGDQLRVFVHYQPSYYHFHVHFMHVKLSSMGAACGRATLLDDVIDHIENIDPAYYQKKTMHYHIGERDPLLTKLAEAGAAGGGGAKRPKVA